MRRDKGFLYLLTLTAPGSEQHWHKSAGRMCECTPAGGIDLPRWNASHSRRWNHFRTVLRRDVPQLEFFRGVEVQDRGALHDHAMVWSPVALSVTGLRRMAIAAGFGHSIDLAPCAPGSRKAAYYVSKYVTKACDSRGSVPWWGELVDYETGEVTEDVVDGRYRTWSMSRSWGKTMTLVRAEAAAYAQGIRDKEATQGLENIWAAFSDLTMISESPPAPS